MNYLGNSYKINLIIIKKSQNASPKPFFGIMLCSLKIHVIYTYFYRKLVLERKQYICTDIKDKFFMSLFICTIISWVVSLFYNDINWDDIG